jgi:hypothetical protein
MSSVREPAWPPYDEVVQKIYSSETWQKCLSMDSSWHSTILPTRRWGKPALCLFVCPAELSPDEPSVVYPPDRWAVFDARWGRLMLYALVDIFSFSREPWPPLQRRDSPEPQTIAEARIALGELRELIEELMPKFFAGPDSGSDVEKRHRLRDLLCSDSAGLDAWERLIAPDFFDWLENA